MEKNEVCRPCCVRNEHGASPWGGVSIGWFIHNSRVGGARIPMEAEGKTVDLSIGGAKFESPLTAKSGKQVTVQPVVPGAEVPIDIDTLCRSTAAAS